MISAATIHLLAESGDPLRDQLAAAGRNAGWQVASHAAADELLRKFPAERNACLVVAPGRHGPLPAMELIRSLRERWFNAPILLAVGNSEPNSLEVAAVHSGAFDVIRRPVADDRLCLQLDRALDFDRQGSGLPSLVRARLATLSKKEREVLDLTLEGQSTNSMASALGVCYQTINKHRARIRLKMRAKCDMVLANALRGQPPLPHECGYAVARSEQPEAPPLGAPAAPHLGDRPTAGYGHSLS